MKVYLAILLVVATITVLSSIAASLIVDPYSIVHPLLGAYAFDPNNRVPKTALLTRDCLRYDAYFVGDSRSAILSGSDLGGVRDRRFYNFSTWADDIVSIDRRLNFLIARGCPVAAVVVGESLDVVLDRAEEISHSLMLSENAAVSGENLLAFYSKYFLSSQGLVAYVRAVLKDPAIRDIYYADGHVNYAFAMPDAGEFALARCRARTLNATDQLALFAKLAGYRELVRMSARHHFKAVVWIAPMNTWASEFLDDPAVAEYLRALRAIPNLHLVESDRASPLLADFRNWHDCGHFRPVVFDRLVASAVTHVLQD